MSNCSFHHFQLIQINFSYLIRLKFRCFVYECFGISINAFTQRKIIFAKVFDAFV